MEVLHVNQYLKHDTFGLGVVTASDPQRTTIKFKDFGVKKFITDVLQAELLPRQPLSRANLLELLKQNRVGRASRGRKSN
jgi:hypothetical protein